MSVTAAIADLNAKLLSLPGMQIVPDAPVESAGWFPFAVAYEALGYTNTLAANEADDLATIYCEIHVAKVWLNTAILQAMGFRDAFLQKLIADPTLGGTVSTINDIRRAFGRLEWGTVETIGYRFEVDIKVHMV